MGGVTEGAQKGPLGYALLKRTMSLISVSDSEVHLGLVVQGLGDCWWRLRRWDGGGGGGNVSGNGGEAAGGVGGGGNPSGNTAGASGTANTGGGGHGQGSGSTHGNGGSGIIVIRAPLIG